MRSLRLYVIGIAFGAVTGCAAGLLTVEVANLYERIRTLERFVGQLQMNEAFRNLEDKRHEQDR